MGQHRDLYDIGELLSQDLGDEPDPVLPFAWEAVPRRPADAEGLARLRSNAGWSTQLPSGRTIHLASLEQCSTLGGVLCGSPRQPWFNDWLVKNAVESTASAHSIEPSRVVVLAPLMTAVRARRRDDEPGEREIELLHLPPVRSVAVFRSGPLSGSGSGFSTALVLWYQDTYGLPTPGHVTEQLWMIDWSAVAVDGDD